MRNGYPTSLPEPHGAFLCRAVDRLSRDPRLVGIAVGGSLLSDSMDEFSDLDLVVVHEEHQQDSVLADREHIARSLGTVLSAFTGEHVGEPHLLICLYDEVPPLHVDLKFVTLAAMEKRVEDPFVMWEREGCVTRALAGATAAYPQPDLEWIEDRFWVWVHYAASKIGRGELFEAVDFLAFLRGTVLGPLALTASGARPTGVRRVETLAPTYVRALAETVANVDARDCARALRAAVELYRRLRGERGKVEGRAAAELAATQYLSGIEQRDQAAPAPRAAPR